MHRLTTSGGGLGTHAHPIALAGAEEAEDAEHAEPADLDPHPDRRASGRGEYDGDKQEVMEF